MKNFKFNFKSIVRSKARWLLTLIILLTIGIGQANAWYYIVGDFVGGWSDHKPSGGEMIDHYRSFYRVEPNADGSPKKYWFKVDDGGGGQSTTNTMNNVSGRIKTGCGGNDGKTMWIEIYEKSDVQFHITNYGDKTIDVTVTPSWHIKYPWYGESGWKWSGDMYSNGNGTYATDGNYNSGVNNFNYSDDVTDGSPANSTNTILEGDNLYSGLKCFFILNMNGDPSLTIQEKNSTAGTNHMYFDNTNAGWSDANIQFVLGHLSYTRTYTMSKVGASDYTNLYYVARSGNDWTSDGCFAYFGMIGKDSKFNDGAYGCRNMYDATHHSEPLYKHLNLSDGYYYMISKEDNINGNPITIEQKGNSYTILNFSQTVKYQVSSNNGSSFSNMSSSDGKTPATITGSSYAFNNISTVTGTSLAAALTVNTTTRYSTTISAGYTGKTTLSISSLRSGYKFVGWYDNDDNELGTATSCTYRPTSTNIVSARFENRWALKGNMLSQDFTTENPITHFAQNVSGQDVGYIELDLPGNDEFEFKIYDRAAALKAWYSCNEEVFDYADDNGVAKTCTHEESESNMVIHTAAPGTYRFTWNADTKELTVTYPNSYKVTYDGNGSTDGDVPTDDDYYASGATVTVKGNSESLEKDGYDALAYWTTAAGSGSEYAISTGTFSISANTPLYAKWTQTIALDKNGSDGSNTTAVATYNGAGPFAPAAEQTYTNHTLVDYRTSGGTSVLTKTGAFISGTITDYVTGSKWTKAGETTLYAHWKVNEPSISYTDNVVTITAAEGATIYYTTDGSTTPTSSSTEYDGTFTIDETTTVKAIAVQDGCTDSDVKTVECTYTPAYTVTINATNVDSDGGNATSVLENHEYSATFSEVSNYDLPDDVTVTIGGSELTQGEDFTWNQGTGTLTIPENKIDGNVSITVTGVAESYTVTLNTNGGTINSGDVTSYTYGVGATLPTDVTRDGYRFEGWRDNEELTGSAITTIGTSETGDKEYYAKWAQLYTITNGNPSNGSITVASEAAAGDIVDISASGDTGYDFSSWDIYKTGTPATKTTPTAATATTTFTMPAYAVTVDASFTERTYTDGILDKTGGSANGKYSVTFHDTKIVIDDGDEPVKAGFEVDGYYIYNSGSDYAVRVAESNGALNPSCKYSSVDYTDGNSKWIYAGIPTLYTKWKPKTYTITLDPNFPGDGTGTAGSANFTAIAGTADYGSRTMPSKTGYDFAGYWTASSGGDMILSAPNGAIVGDVEGYTDADSKWTNATEDLKLYAHWTAKSYTVTIDPDNGSSTGSVTATYDADMPSASAPTFTGYSFGGYYDGHAGTGKQYYDEDMLSVNTWDKASATTLYAKWTQSVELDENNGGTTPGSVTATYKGGLADDMSVPEWEDENENVYTVEGYYADEDCHYKVMEANGQLVNCSGYVSGGKWVHGSATTLYAKWVYVIYRTGDSSEDEHTATGYVESYTGSAIPTHIEYRMKVGSIGQWYSLSIPFSVDSVCVWDAEDGRYYKMQPCYRSEVGGKLWAGHYVIRTPAKTTDFPISEFGDWRDPDSYSFTPAGNTPYIIQWTNSYFQNRYVSFFGTDDGTWGEMVAGDAPDDDNVINVHGNNSMTSGSVKGAYVLDPTYGSGAWLRGENADDDTDVLPFECYIRASEKSTGKFLVIRRGMTTEDEATGWIPLGDSSESATKVLIDGQLYIIRDGVIYDAQGARIK